MPIGDVTSNEKGSGARYNDGKPAFELIPLHLLDGTAHVLQHGSQKYAAWNWAKGMPWSVPYACVIRHMSAWYKGETIDKESGYSHLDHAICNLLMLKHYEEMYKDGDDRPAEHFNT